MPITAELLGKGLALAGFLFTVGTYAYNQHVDRQEQRYKESMALIQQYKADIRADENKLTQRLLYYSADVDVNDAESFPDDLFEPFAKETLFGFTGDEAAAGTDIEPFLGQFLDIADFFAGVGFCLDAGICDVDVAGRFFCPRARAFAERNRRLIAYYQDYAGSKEWSDELDHLTNNCNAYT